MINTVIFVATCGALSLLMGWKRVDAWPVTRYTMFSYPVDRDPLRIIRIRLVSHDGLSCWWAPRFYRYPDRISERILRGGPTGLLRGAAEAMRLIELEHPGRYSSLRFIERRWNGREIEETLLAEVPVRPHVF